MTNDCGRCTPCNCELPKVKRELLLTDLPNFSLRRAGKCEDPRHSGGVAQFRPNVALAFLLTPGMTRALERFTAEAFASLFNQVKERDAHVATTSIKVLPHLPAYLFDSMSKQIHPIHHFFLRVGLEYCEKDAQEMQGFADSLHVLVINSTDEKRTWSLLPFKPCCGRID